MQSVTAGDICLMLNGTIEGNPNVLIHGPSKIEEAIPGTISFLANPKYESFAYTTEASALLVNDEFQPLKPLRPTLIRVNDVYASVAFLLDKFGASGVDHKIGTSALASIHKTALVAPDSFVGDFTVIEPDAQVGSGCYVYPQVYIGRNVKVGRNVTLYPGVRILQDCVVGDNVIIHANAVIGSDGFGFAPQPDGTYRKIAQIGNVIIENNVEIGANTTIDRATMGSTIIKSGAKLDNLVQIAHNVSVGSNTVIAAQAGIAGSTKVGENVQIGGQAGLAGHLQIFDKVKIQAQSGINSNIEEGKAVYGSPQLEYREYLRSYAIFRQLPDLVKKISELEKQLAEALANKK
jgi:UDP-3-O-[3-hydroxymyristoyl] glucosamine N-acyltransferase